MAEEMEPPAEGAGDPAQDLTKVVEMIGQGVAVLGDSMAGAPPEVGKAVQELQASYEKMVGALSGGGQGGPEQAPPMDEMAGGNPNAVPVR